MKYWGQGRRDSVDMGTSGLKGDTLPGSPAA